MSKNLKSARYKVVHPEGNEGIKTITFRPRKGSRYQPGVPFDITDSKPSRSKAKS